MGRAPARARPGLSREDHLGLDGRVPLTRRGPSGSFTCGAGARPGSEVATRRWAPRRHRARTGVHGSQASAQRRRSDRSARSRAPAPGGAPAPAHAPRARTPGLARSDRRDARDAGGNGHGAGRKTGRKARQHLAADDLGKSPGRGHPQGQRRQMDAAGTSPTHFQWQRCEPELECTDIPLATTPEYTARYVDIGSTLRVLITATNTAARPKRSRNGPPRSSAWLPRTPNLP